MKINSKLDKVDKISRQSQSSSSLSITIRRFLSFWTIFTLPWNIWNVHPLMDPMFAPVKIGAVEDSDGSLDWSINVVVVELAAMSVVERVTASNPWLWTLDKAHLWIQKHQLCWGSKTSYLGVLHWLTCRTVNSPCYSVRLQSSLEHQHQRASKNRISNFFSLSVKASILRCSGQKLCHLIFSERCLHIPNFFIWSSIMADR